MSVEAPEGRSLPSLLVPSLRVSLLSLSRKDSAKHYASAALGALANFAEAWNVSFGGAVTLSLDFSREPGVADNGDLDLDLQQLLEATGLAARAGDTCIALFVDELQYVPESELAALITALHRSAQRMLPITLVGAGLPQIRAQLGIAKSYAERLFDFVEIGSLPETDARQALAKPLEDEGVDIDPDALALIVERTQGYPYFLQEWGKHVWNTATSSPISKSDVITGGSLAQDDLDTGFFRVRFDRLTQAEHRYVRGMAELGAGPYRTSEVASTLQREIQSLSPVRQSLIEKGMVWSPGHGEIAFTVPLFDEFMKRTMPELE